MNLSRDEVQHIADEAANKAVSQVLLDLGIDHATPLEMQRDFQHLRKMRLTTEAVKRQTLISLVGFALLGMATIIVLGFREWLKSPT